jgi:hypothetical protein
VEFNLSGKGDENGNNCKGKWDKKAMELVAADFAAKIADILHSSPELNGFKLIAIKENQMSKKIIAESKEAHGKFFKSVSMLSLASLGCFLTFRSLHLENTASESSKPSSVINMRRVVGA